MKSPGFGGCKKFTRQLVLNAAGVVNNWNPLWGGIFIESNNTRRTEISTVYQKLGGKREVEKKKFDKLVLSIAINRGPIRRRLANFRTLPVPSEEISIDWTRERNKRNSGKLWRSEIVLCPTIINRTSTGSLQAPEGFRKAGIVGKRRFCFSDVSILEIPGSTSER